MNIKVFFLNKNEKTIVNKIIHNNTNTQITGSFIFGFGNINGNYITEYIEINHCNEFSTPFVFSNA